MIGKVAGILLAAVAATSGRASDGAAYVIPVVTAEVNGRVYTTNFAARNRGPQDVTCEAIYAIPNDPKGGTLRAMYTVPAGGTPIVEEDLLLAAGAVGTMRIACSAPVTVAARVQVSTDGGRTFDEGRTYPGFDEAGAFRDARTIRATSDLLVAEVAGNAVAFEAIVTNEIGEELGRKTYELPAFAQQVVNLSAVRKSTKTPRVEIRIVRGEGAVVAGEETRDPESLRMAVRRSVPSGTSAIAMPAVQAAPTGVRATRELVTSPFQAAPFRDPVTGLDFFRNRWYDPATGTFITPDPMGYGDSPNVYAFAGGDPVNGRDPTGEITLKAALTDARLTDDEILTIELTDDETRAIITSARVRLANPSDPKAATINRKRAQLVLGLRRPAFQLANRYFYEFIRALNPSQYQGEAGYAIATGREPVMGNKISRADKALELITYIAFTRGTEYALGQLREGAIPGIPRQPKPSEPERILPREMPKGRGSTADPSKGRFLPRDVRETLALREVLSNPENGRVLPITMTDPRWPASEGWVKMQQTISPGGRRMVVHYVRNTRTGEVDDLKIVDGP